MTVKWTLVIPMVPPSLNSKGAKGWPYARTKAEWLRTVALLCREQKIPRLEKVRTEPRIYFARESNRGRDYDNFTLVNKLVHDGIVAAGVIPDDRPCYLAKPSYPDLLVDPSNPRTEVDVIAVRP